ncbi:hypothetical protein ACFC09_11030 [Streptomyces sp. NPDC056161]|uniref:hypothetical protein n=1 Tax=Streptomyces sp. NPDC056161 TaxID=3345732 RepID=UPI0035E36F43
MPAPAHLSFPAQHKPGHKPGHKAGHEPVRAPGYEPGPVPPTDPENTHHCVFSAEGAHVETPLTSEPPLPDAEPLTSEPPLTDLAPLTSESDAAEDPIGADMLTPGR